MASLSLYASCFGKWVFSGGFIPCRCYVELYQVATMSITLKSWWCMPCHLQPQKQQQPFDNYLPTKAKMSVITTVQSLMMLSKGGAPSEDALLFSLLAAHCYQEQISKKTRTIHAKQKVANTTKKPSPPTKSHLNPPRNQRNQMLCHDLCHGLLSHQSLAIYL